MKTTVELSTPLVKEAKKLAIETDATLRDLIEQGLQWVVAGGPASERRAGGRPSIETVGRGAWRGTHPDKYVAHLRRNWK